MKDLRNLRQRLKENLNERDKICKCTGLTRNSLRRKLYNPKKFTIGEIVVFKRVLSLSMEETIKIFAPFVANYN